MYEKLKKIFLIAMIALVFSQSSSAQDFYHDYKSYLEGIRNVKSLKKFKDPNTPKLEIERIRSLINEVKIKTGILMLSRDSIFIVTYRDVDVPTTSVLLWNKEHSCFYDYSFELKKWEIKNQKLQLDVDASARVNDLRPDFKKTVETIDTLNYNIYGKLNSGFDGKAVRFTVGIKSKKHWYFVSSKSFVTIVNKGFSQNIK